MTAPLKDGPLSGLRVLDFAWVWSGPQVAAWLGEFGAEVIKIEHGKRLDNTRLRARPVIDGVQAEGPSIELHPYFHQTNHGKRSITLDLKRPEAIALIHELAKTSDIVIENLSPGALGRLGLDYASLSAVNPKIVYLSMSALGQTGPQADLRAYAPIMSSFGGIEAQVGYPGERPIGMMNYGLGDPNAAVHALLPLLAALYRREDDGLGCHIDMAQIEAMISALPEPALEALAGGPVSPPPGNRSRDAAPHGVFPAAGEDAWVTVAVVTDAQWAKLAPLIGMDEPALATLDGRLAEVERIEAALAAWTSQRSRESVSENLRALGIASSPVLSVAEQWADPSLAERGVSRQVTHPILGPEKLYAAPWRMSETRPRIEASAPLLGADNDAVFLDILGLDPAQLEALKADGVVA